MAWLEAHQSLATNRKTLRLKRLLHISKATAIGHLMLLWWWALDNAPDGDLSEFGEEELAEIAEWPGKGAVKFAEALKTAGFIDPDGKLHDWDEYTGRLISKREQQREAARIRKQRSREQPRESSENVTRDTGVTDAEIEEASQPCHTPIQYSNSTVPNIPPISPSSPSVSRDQKVSYAEYVSMTEKEFQAICQKVGEQGALRCIEILDNYKGASGKRYKSDYRAILNWVIERYEKEPRAEPETPVVYPYPSPADDKLAEIPDGATLADVLPPTEEASL